MTCANKTHQGGFLFAFIDTNLICYKTFLPSKVNTFDQEPPFLTRKEGADAEGLTGNDIYEGYCVSLISLLARDLGFTYELREVMDKFITIR